MRLIGSLKSEQKGIVFSRFLERKGISNQIDTRTNTDWGSPDYGTAESHIWIGDEDQVPEALKWYQFYLDHPNDPIFAQTEPLFPLQDAVEVPKCKTDTTSVWERQPMGWVTKGILAICTSLLVFSHLMTTGSSTSIDKTVLGIYNSPVDNTLLYDYPDYYELLNRYVKLYGDVGLQNINNVPPEGQALLNKIRQTPTWQGIYRQLTKKEQSPSPPMFEKIRQGEIWRLFTPALLHADIFHLFFNMIWLIVLGKQMEQRLKPARYILFLLIVGIFSNTCQYLMSGPNFLGFSGILCGMLTFIWARQQQAPWEGYQLNRMTYLFMLAFILGMAGLQFLSFLLEKSLNFDISLNVANMAHLSGALIGYCIGRINTFRWRHS